MPCGMLFVGSELQYSAALLARVGCSGMHAWLPGCCLGSQCSAFSAFLHAGCSLTPSPPSTAPPFPPLALRLPTRPSPGSIVDMLACVDGKTYPVLMQQRQDDKSQFVVQPAARRLNALVLLLVRGVGLAVTTGNQLDQHLHMAGAMSGAGPPKMKRQGHQCCTHKTGCRCSCSSYPASSSSGTMQPALDGHHPGGRAHVLQTPCWGAC